MSKAPEGQGSVPATGSMGPPSAGMRTRLWARATSTSPVAAIGAMTMRLWGPKSVNEKPSSTVVQLASPSSRK
ncbi:MAG: hypothetical protein R3F20_05295 [Planctomycetota bacterium]